MAETTTGAEIGSELGPEAPHTECNEAKISDDTHNSTAVVGNSSGGGEITPCSMQQSTAVATPEAAGTKWLNKACVMLRRYVYVVEDLMEGCGWSTGEST